MRSEIIYAFLLSCVVFLSSAWNNVGTQIGHKCDVMNIMWRKTIKRTEHLFSLTILKDKSKDWGWFLTRFPLKFPEKNDVGEIVIRGL